MTCDDKCIHFPVCEQKKYDFANIDECEYYQEEQPTGDYQKRALLIIDRLINDRAITVRECGTLRRAILLPERPTGEWIDTGEAYIIDMTTGQRIPHTGIEYCSNCGHKMSPIGLMVRNYCPNCGAKMKEAEDEQS